MRQIATWKRPKTFKMVKQMLITNRQKDKVLCAELGRYKRKQESKKKSTYETTLSIKKIFEKNDNGRANSRSIKKKSMMEEKTIKAKKIRARPEKKGFYFKRIKIVFFICRFDH